MSADLFLLIIAIDVVTSSITSGHLLWWAIYASLIYFEDLGHLHGLIDGRDFPEAWSLIFYFFPENNNLCVGALDRQCFVIFLLLFYFLIVYKKTVKSL